MNISNEDILRSIITAIITAVVLHALDKWSTDYKLK